MSNKEDPRSLEPLLRPRSVAVVGASRDPESLGGTVFRNLLRGGFAGPVYPVNPSAAHVESVRAYPSVQAIPDDVDLAVLVVPAAHVLEAVDDCGAKGVRAVVVITAGFAETGPEGEALQEKLLRRVESHGMRMVGPNCVGIINTDPAVRLHATFAGTCPPAGPVALSSQSGALGVVILDRAAALGLGIRHFVSVGNKADVSGNDLLEYWERDPETKVILFYLEDLGHPARFMRLARRIGRKKPILVVKSGRTTSGARAARSHTGALAGLDVAVDALFGQAGIVRADTVEELLDTALLLANQPIPEGRRVAILTNAGGPGIMATDASEGLGLEVATLSPATREALRAFLPAEASLRNPVDMIASASADAYERALRLLLAEPAVDAVLVLFVPPQATMAHAVAQAIRRAAEGAAKPVLTCFMGIHGIADALPPLREGRLPSYPFPEAAARALAHAVRYGAWKARPEGRVPSLAVDAAHVRAVIRGGGEGARWLKPHEVRDVLEAYGLRLARTVFARTADHAAAAAERLGGEVAVKLASDTLVHKTDVGGVRLSVRGPEEARRAFDEIASALAGQGRRAEMSGVVVQEMVTGGLETFAGVTQDPAFGSLVGFGIGGINVEVWRDVVFRVHPLTEEDARDMLGQIRGAALLDGVRGAPAVDRDALADALLRLDRLVGDHPDVVEVDINPLMALAAGQGALAVDARIRVAPASAQNAPPGGGGRENFSVESAPSPG